MADDLVTKQQLLEAQTEIIETMRSIETNMLTAFHKWAGPVERRLKNSERNAGDLSERLAAVETRLRELEAKQ